MFSRKGKKTTPIPKPTEEDERVSQRPYKQRPDSCTNTRSPLGCSWRDGYRCSRLTEAELPGSGVCSLSTAFPCYSCSHRVLWSSLILAVIFWLILDTAKLGHQQLVSFGGLVMYIILLFLFSKHPTRVSTGGSWDEGCVRL